MIGVADHHTFFDQFMASAALPRLEFVGRQKALFLPTVRAIGRQQKHQKIYIGPPFQLHEFNMYDTKILYGDLQNFS